MAPNGFRSSVILARFAIDKRSAKFPPAISPLAIVPEARIAIVRLVASANFIDRPRRR